MAPTALLTVRGGIGGEEAYSTVRPGRVRGGSPGSGAIRESIIEVVSMLWSSTTLRSVTAARLTRVERGRGGVYGRQEHKRSTMLSLW